MPINIDKYLLLKVGSYALTIGGSMVAGIVAKHENAKILEKLVDAKLKQVKE